MLLGIPSYLKLMRMEDDEGAVSGDGIAPENSEAQTPEEAPPIAEPPTQDIHLQPVMYNPEDQPIYTESYVELPVHMPNQVLQQEPAATSIATSTPAHEEVIFGGGLLTRPKVI